MASSLFRSEIEIFLSESKAKRGKSRKKAEFMEEIERQFAFEDPNKIQESIQNHLDTQDNKKTRRFSSTVLSPLISALMEYSGIVDTMVQAWPMPTALVWGGLKILIECSFRYQSQFDKIKAQLERVPALLWDLSSCEELYGLSPYSSPVIQKLLAQSYKSLITFWYRCVNLMSSTGKYTIRSDPKLMSAVDGLEASRNDTARICQLAEAKMQQTTRDKISQEVVYAELERAAAKLERELSAKERLKQENERKEAENERQQAKRHREKEERASLEEKLGGNNELNMALLDSLNRHQKHPGTCEWLLQEASLQDWLNRDSDKPIFWLNAKLGAGKSVLCASIIDHITTHHPDVAFQFLNKDTTISREQILRNISQQLLARIPIESEDLSASLRPFLNINKDDSKALEDFIKFCFRALPFVYIFVDGLDESEYVDVERKMGHDSVRLQDDVKSVVTFLAQEATQLPYRIKLWCSSQSTPSIGRYLFEVDIYNFLQSSLIETLGGNTHLASTIQSSVLSQDIEGSFLWISSMLKDLRENAEDADDMFEMAVNKLPKTMNEHYRLAINRIKRKDSGNKTLPLWKIILSMLVFAKRSLLASEIIEGIAMTRTRLGENLNDKRTVRLDKIQQCCMPFIRFIKRKDDEHDGFLLLSHQSVHAFLLTQLDNSQDTLVNIDIMRDCCIKILMQPKYSQFLQKHGNTRTLANGEVLADSCPKLGNKFTTAEGEEVSDNCLTTYCATYWYEHFDDSSDDDNQRQLVEQFLRSANFLTCIQVQSLFAHRHFIFREHPVTGVYKSARQTLPKWLDNSDIFKQYQDFIAEWGDALIMGKAASCFWNALHTRSFLRRNVGRHNAFLLSHGGETGTIVTAGIISTIKRYPKAFVVCHVQHNTPDTPESTLGYRNMLSDNTSPAQVNVWLLHQTNPPLVDRQIDINLKNSDYDWELNKSIPQTDSLAIPQQPSIKAPTPITLYSNDSFLVVGSKAICLSERSSLISLGVSNIINRKVRVWEDIQVRDSLAVLCSRRIPKSESARFAAREKFRIGELERRYNVIAKFKKRREDVPQVVIQNFQNSGMPNNMRCARSNSTDEERSGESNFGSCSEDASSSDEESEWGGPDDYDGTDALVRESEAELPESESDTGSSAVNFWETSSEEEEPEYLSEDGEESMEFDSDEEFSLQNDGMCDKQRKSSIPLENMGKYEICDSCGTKCINYFQCTICRTEAFKLCRSCKHVGAWCFDICHRLNDIRFGKRFGVKSKTLFDMRQELDIYGTKNGTFIRIFHSSWRYRNLLHRSPPAMHSQHPLVVWPITGQRLVFVDTNTSKSFTMDIRCSSHGNPLFIEVSFSGDLLRVACISIEATKSRANASRKSLGDEIDLHDLPIMKEMVLRLSLKTFALSSKNPTKVHPRTISCRHMKFGCHMPTVQHFPFSFSWTDSEVYWTISSTKLLVYRITLPDASNYKNFRDDSTGPKNLHVRALRETIYLPQSAKNRSVQFIPSSEGEEDSKVIIGPENGNHPQPAVLVLLSLSDADWYDVEPRESFTVMERSELTEVEDSQKKRFSFFDEDGALVYKHLCF